MKLCPDLINYLTRDHFRVLTAIEMGMKNHEFVPVPLIQSLAQLKRGNCFNIITLLLKHKLIFHTGKNYSGYALTYQGYDYLAIKVFMKRGHVRKILCQIGVGKESDIYICESGDKVDENGKSVHNGEPVVVKLARLGRTSFRTVKDNRDYLKGRQASWLYMSRIASLKEHAFMRALHARGFPTPTPYDANRHAICMSLIKAYPMVNIKGLSNPETVYHALIQQIINFAEHGLVHGDFNEFNLMINDQEDITVIDFPQMTSTSHLNAQFYFERDVKCIQRFFSKRFGLAFEGVPVLEKDVEKNIDLDKEVKASGYFEGEDQEALNKIGQQLLEQAGGDSAAAAQQSDDEESDSDEENIDAEQFEVDPELEKQLANEEQKNGNSDDDDQAKEQDDLDKFISSCAQKDAPHDDQASSQDEDSSSEETEAEREWRLKREARSIKKQLRQKEDEKEKANQGAQMEVNYDYVKAKARKQFMSTKSKQNAKTNNNKDKGSMKGKEDIRDCFLYDNL